MCLNFYLSMIAKIYIYSIFHISRYITNTKTFASKQTTKIIEYVIYLCLVKLRKYCGKNHFILPVDKKYSSQQSTTGI